MRKLRSLLLALTLCITAALAMTVTAEAVPNYAVIGETTFPDPVFRDYVSTYCDTNKDNVIGREEIAAVKSISLNNKGVTSLKGVEYFTSLELLYCQANSLTSLDISENTALRGLYCHNNQLTRLDLSKNTALEKIWCYNNAITDLDVTNHSALTVLKVDGDKTLKSLTCSKCSALTNLTIADCSALERLICKEDSLETLSISNCPALMTLNCEGNRLTRLNVDKLTALSNLTCSKNELTALDVSANTALKLLDCGHNQLTALDVSKNTALTSLYCSGNQLTTLDVSKNTALTYLSCVDGTLASLNVSGCTALETLYCYNNQLTSLDLSNCPALVFLSAFTNQLTSLIVGDCTALETMTCTLNKLQSLDVSQNTALKTMSCSDNQLTSLDVSKNTALTYLSCNNNQLTSLDVTRNTALESLGCYGNDIAVLNISACPNLLDAYDGTRTNNGTYYGYSNNGNWLGVDKTTEVLTESLAAPEITSASGSNESGKPTLKWNAVEGAAKYAIYRSGTSSGTYTKMFTTLNTSYTNTSAKAGYTYYYKVCAVDENGQEGLFSAEVGVHCRPAAPKITSANGSNATGKPTLTWNAVEGTKEYVVYRSGTSNGTYTKMHTTTSTSYTNTSANAGYTYYYKVYAVDAKGYWSAASAVNGVHCRPAQPVVTAVTGGSSGKPTLSWKAVTGAKEYVIYRSGSSTGTYSKLYTTSNTSFTNTGAKAGYTYYYKVYAVDAKGYWSAASSVVSAKATK